MEQDADLVVFIYRDKMYARNENNPKMGTAEIIVAKHRNGPSGFARLTFLDAIPDLKTLHLRMINN